MTMLSAKCHYSECEVSSVGSDEKRFEQTICLLNDTPYILHQMT